MKKENLVAYFIPVRMFTFSLVVLAYFFTDDNSGAHCEGEGCCTKGAAGRAGGAYRTQDSLPSHTTGRARGHLRRAAEQRYHVIRGNVSPSRVESTPLAPIAASRFHRSSAVIGMKNAPVGVVGHFVLLAFRMAGYSMTASRRPKSRSCRLSPPSTSPAMSRTGCFHVPLFR